MTKIVRRLVDGSGTLIVAVGGVHESVIAARGEFDLANSARIAEALSERLRAGARSVRLDLSEVTFIDATAVNALVRARTQYRARRAILTISGQRGIVARVLTISGIEPGCAGEPAVSAIP